MQKLSKKKLFNLIVVTILLVTILLVTILSVSNACIDTNKSDKVTLMNGESILYTIDVDKDDKLEMPSDGPAISGYTFEGWFTDAECTIPYEPNLLSADLVLYAKYVPESMYIVLNLNGGSFKMENTRKSVVKGESYTISEVPTKQGQMFDYWLAPDGTEFPATGVFNADDTILVTAMWRNYEAKFVDGEGEELAIIQANSSAKITSKWNEPAAGYEVVGYYTDSEMQTAFDFNNALSSDVNVYVKIAPKTFTITVNGGESATAVYGGEYSLVTPEKAGHNFTGFKYNNEDFPATGEYIWTENITVTATFERNADYYKAVVSFFDGQIQILTELEVDGGEELKVSDLPSAPDKPGYDFAGWFTDATLQTAFADRPVADNEDISLYAKYNAKNYVITLALDGGLVDGETEINVIYNSAYQLPVPTKAGYEFVKYLNNSEEFAINGAYTIDGNIDLSAVWKKVCLDGEDSNYLFISVDNVYFKERNDKTEDFTLIFLSNTSYDLSALGNVTIEGADFTVSNSAFTTGNATASDFKIIIEVTDKNGAKHTLERDARVVEKVVISMGKDYESAWGNGIDRTVNFMDAKTDAIMSVGASDFRPDLLVKNPSTNVTLSINDANLSVLVEREGAEVPNVIYEDGIITFTNDLIGQVATVTLTPKYSPTTTVTFNVRINAGVNVYSNAELDTAYGNLNVSEINILRNIKAEVSASDLVDGDLNNPRPINNYVNGVYTRIDATESDGITVNGNFFTIDASGLPYVNNADDGSDRDWGVESTSYYVSNTQIAVFLYSAEKGGVANDIDNDYYTHGGQANFKDLYISGNVTGNNEFKYFDGTNYTEDKTDSKFLVDSGAYHGIIVRGGTVSIENTTIMKTNIAVFVDGGVSASDSSQISSQITLDYVKLDKSWSNHVYMYNLVSMNIKNSQIGTYSESAGASSCGGSAIHVDDIPQAVKQAAGTYVSTSNLASIVNIDKATKVENFVLGTETWFVSRGMADAATEVKNIVDTALSTYTPQLNPYYGNSLLETATVKKVDWQGEGYERINLVLLVRSAGSGDDNASLWAADIHKNGYIVEDGLPIYCNLINLENSQMDKAFNPNFIPGVYDGQCLTAFQKDLSLGYIRGYVEVFAN